MGRKKKTVEKVKEPKSYEYGDLAVVCSCGSVQVLQKGIQHGLQWTIIPREDSYMWLRCDKCNADLKLCFLEGEKPEEVEKPTESEANTPEANESIQEENKTE